LRLGGNQVLSPAKAQRRKGGKKTKNGRKDKTMRTENELARIAVDAAFQIHTKLGPGLLESVYEVIMAHELRKRGVKTDRQKPVSIEYDELKFDEGFRADLVLDDRVVLELKSVENVLPVHPKQLRTYLRLMKLRLGLLINFNTELIRDGITRVVNGLPE
jgi:GxxExxY protein